MTWFGPTAPSTSGGNAVWSSRRPRKLAPRGGEGVEGPRAALLDDDVAVPLVAGDRAGMRPRRTLPIVEPGDDRARAAPQLSVTKPLASREGGP
jgi:hypothetical protein